MTDAPPSVRPRLTRACAPRPPALDSAVYTLQAAAVSPLPEHPQPGLAVHFWRPGAREAQAEIGVLLGAHAALRPSRSGRRAGQRQDLGRLVIQPLALGALLPRPLELGAAEELSALRACALKLEGALQPEHAALRPGGQDELVGLRLEQSRPWQEAAEPILRRHPRRGGFELTRIFWQLGELARALGAPGLQLALQTDQHPEPQRLQGAVRARQGQAWDEAPEGEAEPGFACALGIGDHDLLALLRGAQGVTLSVGLNQAPVVEGAEAAESRTESRTEARDETRAHRVV